MRICSNSLNRKRTLVVLKYVGMVRPPKRELSIAAAAIYRSFSRGLRKRLGLWDSSPQRLTDSKPPMPAAVVQASKRIVRRLWSLKWSELDHPPRCYGIVPGLISRSASRRRM